MVRSGGLRKITKLRVLRGLFDIPIYVQQDATLRHLFYLETALHVPGGTTTHHQEHRQLYLQHLVFVTPVLLPAYATHSTLKPAATLPRQRQIAVTV
jgi:hypothetical protein